MRDQQIASLLQQALSYLSRNKFNLAEELLQRVLSMQTDHADALHLFGQMRWVQKRYGEAEVLYRQTLAVSPRRAEAHCHLGQLLHATSRQDEAAAALHEALRLKPDLAEAAQELAAVLIILEQYQEAEEIARATLAGPQGNPYRTAALKHNLGIALSHQHRHEEALTEFHAAQALAPGLPKADYNRGNTLQTMGRLDEAEEAFRRALDRNSLDLKAHSDLNQLLYRMRRTDFLHSYEEAIRKHPEKTALFVEKGKFLFLDGRYEEAREMFLRALALAPDDNAARNGLGSALTQLGRFGEAKDEYERLLTADPSNADMRCNFAECLLRAGDAKGSIAVSQRTLAYAPYHQFALALWGVALRQLNDTREDTLNDYESFVQVYDLEAPEGFADMQSFNEALDAHLDRLHVDCREPINRTSRFGTQTTGVLFGAGHEIVEWLKHRIDDAVAAYISRLNESEIHPLLARRAGGFVYGGSWSTRLSDCGFHTNHVHPHGWISSAYYAAVPDVVRDEGETQGWLKFGEPHFDAGFNDPVRRIVQPVPGRLVLFPSYMWHGTVPFRSSQPRMTVAFDIIPWEGT